MSVEDLAAYKQELERILAHLSQTHEPQSRLACAKDFGITLSELINKLEEKPDPFAA